MRISILFHFSDESQPAAITEVEGDVTDVLVPLMGDTVCHRNVEGERFRGQVIGRHFDYSLANGALTDGRITVTLSLDRVVPEEWYAKARTH